MIEYAPVPPPDGNSPGPDVALPSFPEREQKKLLAALGKFVTYLELAPDGTILNANNAYLQMAGYTREELVGRDHRILCASEFLLAEDYSAYWEHLVKNEHTGNFFKGQRKDGAAFWFQGIYYTIKSNKNKPVRVIATGMDISGHLLAAARQAARLEAIGRHFVFIFYTPDAEIISVNENFHTLLGYDATGLHNLRPAATKAWSAVNQAEFQAMWANVRAGRPQTCLMCWTAEDGSRVWLDSVFSPVYCASGKLSQIIQVASDATRRLKHERANADKLDRLSRGIAHTGHAVIISSRMNRIRYVNPAFTRMLGYGVSESLGRSPSFVLGPGEQAYTARLRERMLSKDSFYSEEMAYCKDGRRLWLSILTNPFFNDNGSRDGAVSIITDITEAKLNELLNTKVLEGMACDLPAEHLLSLACNEIERVISGLSVSIFGLGKRGGEVCLEIITAPHQPLRALNQKFCGKCGPLFPPLQAARSGAPVLEKNIAESDYASVVKEAFGTAGLGACLANPIKSASGKVLGVVSFHLPSLDDGAGSLTRLAELMTRLCGLILEREESRARMRRLSFYDPVTGLPNRELLVAGAEQLAAIRSINETKFSMSVLYISIDRFDHLCRAGERLEGDDILRHVAACLAELAAPGDIVGHIFAEEFAVVSPDCTGKQALQKAARIQSCMAQTRLIGNVEMNISLSIGICMFPENGQNIETLLTRASTALFQRRKKNRAALTFFSPALNTAARGTLSLEARLRRALEQKKLYLCYQPQLVVGAGSLRGVEALSRWDDDKHGPVSPEQFIPLAEEAGLMGKLGDWAVREACRQLGEWRRRGVNVPLVSVNLSPTNFKSPRLVGGILAALAENGLSPKDLVLELTENVLIDAESGTLNNIRGVSAAGITLALDDFGTGYSSLSYLKDLPFSEIKLDRSFVRELTSAETCRRLSLAAILIGRGLNMRVTAEGVETFDQYSILKRQQCHSVQGFLFSKALRAPELENWLGAWRPHSMEDQHRLV